MVVVVESGSTSGCGSRSYVVVVVEVVVVVDVVVVEEVVVVVKVVVVVEAVVVVVLVVNTIIILNTGMPSCLVLSYVIIRNAVRMQRCAIRYDAYNTNQNFSS